jgi:hypothetical protein
VRLNQEGGSGRTSKRGAEWWCHFPLLCAHQLASWQGQGLVKMETCC